MAEIVRMPKMSDTMTEGVLVKWHKKVGDTVKSGELVAEVETDKATMEFESYQAGTLLHLGVEEGKAIPVDGILAIMGKPGEDFKDLLASAQKEDEAKLAPAAAAPAEPVAATKPASQASASTVAAPPTPTISAPRVQEIVHSANGDERLKISPLAKRLATEKGIDFGMLKGSGEHGRIVKRDIDWFKPGSFVQGSTLSAKAVTKESFEEVTVTQMRKTIARRLAESKFTAPHFYLTMDVDMDEVVRARESINQVTQVKISFNDFVVKAVATSLREHPAVNSAWLGDRIRYNHHIHIGVAVAVEDGLLVPVVRFADSKSLSQIAVEVKEFAKKAKDKKLQPQDWEGNTFTISNLGMFNIESFTAIINPPDACILAIGAIKQIPVVKNGMVQPGNVMKVTLSCDHRVVDGVVGSKFLNTFKALLENPIVMLGQGNI
jgi:pyruvate dehydrogenase E2 component (dihydrolipoamide acetyltransferase)